MLQKLLASRCISISRWPTQISIAAASRLSMRQGTQRHHHAPILIGADGAGSALRGAMNDHTPLGHSCRIARPRVQGTGDSARQLGAEPFAIEPMRCTSGRAAVTCASRCPTPKAASPSRLFLPAHGPHPSFDTLPDDRRGRIFPRRFPDLLPLIPRFADDYDGHPGRHAVHALS
jgi:kynurenine 3-monooxygenase